MEEEEIEEVIQNISYEDWIGIGVQNGWTLTE